MGQLFDHENLRVYQASIQFVAWLEDIYPGIQRKTSAREHLVRASTSVPVNIAEASGKSSGKERRQFIDTAYGSALECAACLDVLNIVTDLAATSVRGGKSELSAIVGMLIKFRRATARPCVSEERAPYETGQNASHRVFFDHEKMDVYQRALDVVRWADALMRSGNVARPVEAVLDRSLTGVALNIAEGNGKFSRKDRCRFIDHARTAALQAAATLDVLLSRTPVLREDVHTGKTLLADCVRMLVRWRQRIADG